MEQAIIARLLAAAGVAALVGARVYPGALPQGESLPAAICNLISAAPSYSDDGEDGIREDRIQIDCWGSTWTDAKKTARAVVAALSAFDGTAGGIRIRYIVLDREQDLQEAGANAAAYPFRTSLDFLITYDT